MHRFAAILTIAIVFAMPKNASAQQASSAGPYKVLKTAKVGGEGNWDYIYADAAGRRLYIPRRGGGGPAAAADPAATPVPTRLTIFDLDTLEVLEQMGSLIPRRARTS